MQTFQHDSYNHEQREAVGVFEDLSALDAAVAELENTRFPRQDISVIGNPEEVKKKFGREAVNPRWIEDSAHAPRNILIRPEEKTIGATAFIGILAYFGGCAAALLLNPATPTMLVIGITLGSIAGASLGGIITFMIFNMMRMRIQKQIDKGGLVLWVRTPSPRLEETAKHIMAKHGGKHVHAHTMSQ